VLSVLKFSLLVGGELDPEMIGNGLAERATGFESKENGLVPVEGGVKRAGEGHKPGGMKVRSERTGRVPIGQANRKIPDLGRRAVGSLRASPVGLHRRVL
jgi:hypothetical protein